jgi:hypothetical protein
VAKEVLEKSFLQQLDVVSEVQKNGVRVISWTYNLSRRILTIALA